MFGVVYDARVGLVPGFHAGNGGDVGNCVVPVCHYYSMIGL